MTLRGRYRTWREKRTKRAQSPPLREFVYLDDVSVYSLYASVKGPIATQLTETQAASLRTEVNASIGVSSILKSEVGSRLQEETTGGTQVLRKAIIQTTFKDLYDLEQPSFVMHPASRSIQAVPYKSVDDLKRVASTDRSDPRIIDPAALVRGALIELEVELEAEPIFQAGTVMSSVLDIVQDNPALYGVRDLSDLSSVGAVNRLLEKLLGGLVPVRGRALEYEVVELDGKEWIIERELLGQLDGPHVPTRPLFLTGVADQSLFWKDIRRVLFAGSSYSVLARVARNGLNPKWTPVKLVDVLRTVAPEVAALIESANTGLLAAMTTTSAHRVARSEMIEGALISFGLALAESMGQTLDASQLPEVAHGVVEGHSEVSFESVIPRRQAFAAITKFVEDQLGLGVNRATAADFRTAALIEAGFFLDAQVITGPPATVPQELSPGSEPRFLDSEFIAIYW